jgi:hypothetical protein
MEHQFFEIDSPKYKTDMESDLHNSVWVDTALVALPMITCDACGKWGGTDKLRMPVPAELASELGPFPRAAQAIPLEEWKRRSKRWAELLQVPVETLRPTMRIGPPYGAVQGKIRDDVIHPMPGYIWVQDRVKEAVVSAGFTGVRPVEVNLDKGGMPRLWELVVEGKALRTGSTPESLVRCQLCGRLRFPNPEHLTVDTERWDGSDFFTLDHNPAWIIVTERVRDLFVREAFSNCEFLPI